MQSPSSVRSQTALPQRVLSGGPSMPFETVDGKNLTRPNRERGVFGAYPSYVG